MTQWWVVIAGYLVAVAFVSYYLLRLRSRGHR